MLWMWLVGCTGNISAERSVSAPSPDRALFRTASATTRAAHSTLVVSTSSEVVTVLAELRPGTHRLTDLPRNAAVSKVEASGDHLSISTVTGVEDGQSLWKSSTERVGVVEFVGPPITMPASAVGWALMPDLEGYRLGAQRGIPVLQDNLNAHGTLDVFVRVLRDDIPIATGFSTDVSFSPNDASEGGSPIARVEISGWTETPTLVAVQYTNTTAHAETISLEVDGQRNARSFGSGSGLSAKETDVSPRGIASAVEGVDPLFHDGWVARVKRSFRGAGRGGFAEVNVFQSVPARGEHKTFTLSSADIPRTFENVRWDVRTRQVGLDWAGVSCEHTAYVLVRAILELYQPETGRGILWEVIAPASGSVALPMLPPELDREILKAMVDPSFRFGVVVEALAVEATYASAAHIEEHTVGANDGKYTCYVSYGEAIR